MMHIYYCISQITKSMKKVGHRYRKCANCPHSSVIQRKCCCQGSSVSTNRNRALTSRPKRQQSTIDNSSIVNTTVPTIMAEFSALRNQNNNLKRELLNVSAFLKEDSHTLSIHHNEPTLSEKLFISNKNLKESLIEIDNLSKVNKELFDRNTYLTELSEGLKIQLKEIQNYLEKYKKRCKKYSKTIQQIPHREQVDAIIHKNVQLQQQNKVLKQQIRGLKFQNKNFSIIGNLSPQWVAHTNNKISKNEQAFRHQEDYKEIDMEAFKRSLSQTINLLKNQNSHFTSSTYDNIGDIEMVGIEDLIKNLMSTYSESIFAHFSLLVKQMNRKLNTYEKKLSNLTSKLQNFLIIVRNKKLKKKYHPTMSFIKTQRQPMADLTNRMF